MSKLRSRLSYANVTATLALFLALGGTSYAVVLLPRDSVGRAQIRSRAVGSAELGGNAVSSRAIRDRAILLRDISPSARAALQGAVGATGPIGPKGDPGPPGIAFHAAVNSAGGLVRGNATAGGNAPGDGVFTVEWAQDVSGCQSVATLARVTGGAVEDPPAGRINVRPAGRGVEVRTYGSDGASTDLPFNVVVVC